ncbi:TlpA disulfide reductase family protein [Porphyromonas pogonae]|uniref:TlpA family protein disulfide reductase n=1 Tax=Porphyromonas pogonae TaxID=867595 RepID=UPI002E79DB9D|nr:TlpA disulfide reductase family protein [Porphyromonas pogonae]
MKKLFFISLLLIACLQAKAQIPSVTIKDIDGKSIQTETLKNGDKPMIISFFATWCKPCLRELNAINEVYDDWQEETGVKLIAVSIDDGANSFKVKPLVKAQNWQYQVLLDTNSDLMRAMNVSMVPTIFVVDKNGKIVYRHAGYTEGSENELIKQVKNCM